MCPKNLKVCKGTTVDVKNEHSNTRALQDEALGTKSIHTRHASSSKL